MHSPLDAMRRYNKKIYAEYHEFLCALIGTAVCGADANKLHMEKTFSARLDRTWIWNMWENHETKS